MGEFRGVGEDDADALCTLSGAGVYDGEAAAAAMFLVPPIVATVRILFLRLRAINCGKRT